MDKVRSTWPYSNPKKLFLLKLEENIVFTTYSLCKPMVKKTN